MKEDAIFGVQFNIAIQNSDFVAVPAGNGREVVWLCNNSGTAAVSVSFGQPATNAQGFRLAINEPNVRVTRAEIGGLIDAEIHAIGSASAGILTVFVGYKKR